MKLLNNNINTREGVKTIFAVRRTCSVGCAPADFSHLVGRAKSQSAKRTKSRRNKIPRWQQHYNAQESVLYISCQVQRRREIESWKTLKI